MFKNNIKKINELEEKQETTSRRLKTLSDYNSPRQKNAITKLESLYKICNRKIVKGSQFIRCSVARIDRVKAVKMCNSYSKEILVENKVELVEGQKYSKK